MKLSFSGGCRHAAQHSFLRKGLLTAQGFKAGSPGNGLQYSQPPSLNGADNLKIAPLDVSGSHIPPLGSSLDSKSSLGSFVPGSSLPSSATSYYVQVN